LDVHIFVKIKFFHFVFKLNLVLINRPAHNSGLAKATRKFVRKLSIRYAAFAKPPNVMRQLASSNKALPHGGTHKSTLTGFANAPANRKLPNRTSDTSQPHNTV
jgi:hypothetical protein